MKPVETRLHGEDRAVYLPAISDSFARQVYRNLPIGTTGLTTGDLNLLDPQSSLFHYPYALYSAGQAAPAGGGQAPPCMVTTRDRDETIILGDSGGYQIQTGAIEFNAQTPVRMMRWMESVSDWSMVLDFPTGGIGSGNLRPHIERLNANGHNISALTAANKMGDDYNACLLQTQLNNEEFVAHHSPGATRFLNVLQGRNERESRHWYEAVKHYPFSGWAFAGAHQNSFSMILARLLDMKRDGILEQCGWLHVLGISTLPVGALLTAVQRAVRRNGAPNFQISFDTSSPFQMAVKQTVLHGFTLDAQGWSAHTLALSDIDASQNGRLLLDVMTESLEEKAQGRLTRVAHTALSTRINVGDLRKACGQLISADGYNILMAHNVEAMLDGHQFAHQTMHEDGLLNGHHNVPLQVKSIQSMIEMLLDGKDKEGNAIADPYALIVKWKPYLDALRDQ